MSQLEMYHIKQEIHWTQRARKSWIQLGDRNTKYFQPVETIRKRYNTIWRIKDAQGNWFDDQAGISRPITNEF